MSKNKTKRCFACKKTLLFKKFSSHKHNKDGLQTCCKLCAGIYKRNGKQRIEDRRQQRMRLVLSYLKSMGCIDCGEKDPRVLEFDHVREQKSDCVSNLITSHSTKRIFQEISKCEVRCANCHKRKTVKQLNQFKYIDFDTLEELDSEHIKCLFS